MRLMSMTRWCLAIVAISGGACGGGSGKARDGGVDGAVDPNHAVGTYDPFNVPALDILFMIDDSSSMRNAQDNLLRNFPTFVTRLQEPPGLPDIHLAVISSDMGAGDGSIDGCDAAGGKAGIFQSTPRGTCTSSGLNAGATFISDNGLGVKNYTGNLEDAFSCIAALGETGCGFEHQLGAVLRALGADGQAPPQENQGFLRNDAILAIVMLTDEDDCSKAPGSAIFDSSSNSLTSELGPVINFRCNEFGHLCGGARPGRAAPNNNMSAVFSYSDCVSNDSGDYLLSVVETANKIKALKTDPAKEIAVASIQAPTTPYQVTWKAPSVTDTSCGVASCPWPAIAHSCTALDGSFGDPGVRTAAFIEQFGANGLLLPICADSFAPSLDRIAMLLRAQIGPPCITGRVAQVAGTQELDCKVTVRYASANGSITNKPVPSCFDSGDEWPCWQLTAGSGSCGNGQQLDVKPDPEGPLSDQTVSYDCRLCDPAEPDPAIGCP
jgi:hypothetical protein